MAIRVGDEVGPYKIQQLLGRGSYSTVLLGQDALHPERRYALKVIACDHMDMNLAADAMKEAIAEAQLLERLRHPNIVCCHQLCWDIERCAVWLALDFMDGGDLQGLIEGWRGFSSTVVMNPGRYQATLLRRVLAALGSALMYTHSQGVLHRDVKPSNVLLSRGFTTIKLADFGISKLLVATGRARTAVGTPYYLSPEIVSGEPYGPASDAWALGVCLYELTVLQRPFRAQNQLALACQIAQQVPEPLPEGCASDIVQIVDGLLIKDPSERLQLPEALGLLHEPQLLNPGTVDADSHVSSHCCSIGVIGRRSSHPRRAFGSPNRNREPSSDKKNGSRRRWPRFKLVSKSRLSRVAASLAESPENATQSMKLVSSPCLAGHSLQLCTATEERLSCGTCHQQVEVGSPMWGCSTCSFSICESCGRREAEWKVIALDDFNDSM